jgi:hypothetical protein
MKSPRRGQPRAMHPTTTLRALLCVLPMIGCVLGTDQLGEPDDTGTSSTNGSNPGDDDGMSGGTPGSASASSTSASDGTTTDASNTDDDDDDDGAFLDVHVPCDDGACLDVASGQPCDPWVQDCLPGAKCMPFAREGHSWNDNACFPIADDPNAVGEPCTVVGSGVSGFDDCELGAVCWYVDPDTLEGTCVAQCDGTPDAPICAAGTSCVIANEGVLTLCLQDCEADPESCPAGQICVPFDDDVVCVPDGPNPGGYGEDCSAFECDPGLVCIFAEDHAACDADACCTPYCTLDGRPCPDGMTCELQGETDIGICVVP